MNIKDLLKASLFEKQDDLEETLVITFHKDGRIRTVHNETQFRPVLRELREGHVITLVKNGDSEPILLENGEDCDCELCKDS